MRILIVGGDGIVGRTAVAALSPRHEIVKVGRKSGDVLADITDMASVMAMFGKTGKVDAIISAAGHGHYGPLVDMTAANFLVGVNDKLMGQVMLVLIGMHHVNDAGSITLTSGIADRDPVRGGANAAAVNGALGAFVKAAALEMPRGIRINVVSPGVLDVAAAKYERVFPGHIPVSSHRVGQTYLKSVEGGMTGEVLIADG